MKTFVMYVLCMLLLCHIFCRFYCADLHDFFWDIGAFMSFTSSLVRHFQFGMKCLMDLFSVRRNIHIVEVVIVILLSLISLSLAPLITEYQYDGYLCLPKSHSFLFYGVVLPGTVQFAIGLSLYLGAIWIIQRIYAPCYFRTMNSSISSKRDNDEF